MVEKTTYQKLVSTARKQMLPSFRVEQDKQAIERVIDIIMDEFAHAATAVIDHKFYLSQFGTNDYLDHSCIVKYLEQLDSRISNKTEDQKDFEQAYEISNSTSVK